MIGMLILLIAACLQAPLDDATLDDPAKSILWAKTWGDAFEEATLRNVPVLVFLTSDN